MKKIIVTGGRDFNDAGLVFDVLERINADVIIHGDCRGLDTLAKKYAIAKGLQQIPFPADWSLGKSAGPRRNIQMIETHPDAILIAFPGETGTANCIREARARGMIVIQVL